MTEHEMIVTYFKLKEKEQQTKALPANLDAFLGKGTFAAGHAHFVLLREDGTVNGMGDNSFGQCNVSGWTDIVKVAAGEFHSVGLKKDGMVLAVGDNRYGQCNVSGWRGIKDIFADKALTVGITSDDEVMVNGDPQTDSDGELFPMENKPLREQTEKNISNTPESDFTYVNWDEGICIWNYSGKANEIRIPDSIEGEPVIGIGTGAFERLSARTIVLPKNLRSIRAGAFIGCGNLGLIRIPSSVTVIGDNAFQDCVSLDTVILPEGLEMLGRKAFANCPSLKKVVIPLATQKRLGTFALKRAFDDVSVIVKE